MTFPQADQPHLEIGLNNQRSILHQLYNLVIMTVETREELERSWQILVPRRRKRNPPETEERRATRPKKPKAS
jgi:hypothetical protein